jgi:hypothetical protein
LWKNQSIFERDFEQGMIVRTVPFDISYKRSACRIANAAAQWHNRMRQTTSLGYQPELGKVIMKLTSVPYC